MKKQKKDHIKAYKRACLIWWLSIITALLILNLVFTLIK